jgi:EmrB/QacA subfamily drug resistance transporter
MPFHYDGKIRVIHSHYSTSRLMGLGLSAMLIPLGSTMIAVALPSIGTEFSRAPGELTQWLVNSYLLVSIVGQGPGGKTGDHWGYKNTLRLGQWIFGAGCLLAVFFHAFGAIVASRLLMAFGGAFMVPTVMAVLKITVPPEKRHRVFGYFGAMMGFAAALGPFLGGFLVHHFGWKSIFLMNLPALLLSVLLSRGFFKEDLHEKPQGDFRFDWTGTFLMACGLLCLVLGLKERPTLLAPALLLLVFFIWWEKKTPHPLMDLRLFSHRSFAAGCAMVGLQNLGMYALLFQLPYLLKLLYQWGPERSGPYMTTFMVSMMAASMMGGRVAEKAGVRATCIAGSLISVGGLYWLSLLIPGEDGLRIIGGLVLGGVGLGIANGPAQSAAMASIEKKQSGIASGVLSTCRYLGGVLGISILGVLFSTPDSAASLGRYHLAILAFAGSFVVAALVSFLLPGRGKPLGDQ